MPPNNSTTPLAHRHTRSSFAHAHGEQTTLLLFPKNVVIVAGVLPQEHATRRGQPLSLTTTARFRVEGSAVPYGCSQRCDPWTKSPAESDSLHARAQRHEQSFLTGLRELSNDVDAALTVDFGVSHDLVDLVTNGAATNTMPRTSRRLSDGR